MSGIPLCSSTDCQQRHLWRQCDPSFQQMACPSFQLVACSFIAAQGGTPGLLQPLAEEAPHAEELCLHQFSVRSRAACMEVEPYPHLLPPEPQLQSPERHVLRPGLGETDVQPAAQQQCSEAILFHVPALDLEASAVERSGRCPAEQSLSKLRRQLHWQVANPDPEPGSQFLVKEQCWSQQQSSESKLPLGPSAKVEPRQPQQSFCTAGPKCQ